jgi:preprotein translocase subunit SecA
MIEQIIRRIFWDPSEKKVKEITTFVAKIHEAEKQFSEFTLDDVKTKTAEFKALFENLDFKNSEDSIKITKLLEDIKCDAFALHKKACILISGQEFELSDGKKITWNMVPYDVQLVGGLSIHAGSISEMKTGEWKTLVATLPSYLNALTWNTVQVVTVNDYLAQRDSEEMGILYQALGLTVWVIYNAQNKEEKKAAYNCDVVYATNNELGFDYLRDNMVHSNEDKVQSPLFFAVVDEVDSILIDEARTPLIISMPDNEPTTKYMKFAALSKNLKKWVDYKIDEKGKTATLTEAGITNIEWLLHIDNIYVSNHYNDLHHIENSIKAKAVYEKDKDYLLVDGEVLIIDEHTGRVLAGRRYSEGLHQAIEAKEWVTIKQESKTLASITFQNYFRMYWKLAGMTGTAKTEEEEFYKVYGLETLVIPTNKPIARKDQQDLLFKNEKGKFDYVVTLIKELHETGQPILVGTVSVDKSEYLSKRLKAVNIPHNVLNAKHHEREAEIVANAGQKWAITIATNMAWRGTDIKLGEGVVDLGGLIILGTEKHETRRIDNQLRGRAWRQGDPWMTQYLISPNDDIMRIFGGDKLFSVFNSPMFASLPDEEPLTQSGMLTKRVTSVQKQVEWHHFDSRKHVLEYDDVINKHRGIIYAKRNAILDAENIDENIMTMIYTQVSRLVEAEVTRSGDELDRLKLRKKVNEFLGVEVFQDAMENDDINAMDPSVLADYIAKLAQDEMTDLKAKANLEEFYSLERKIMLQSIDELWMRHIDAMSNLREDVAFEGYAQRNPLIVYKEKAYDKFKNLMDELEYKVIKSLFSVKTISEVEIKELDQASFKENEAELEKLLNNFSEDNKQKTKSSNANPLFATPQNAPQKKSPTEKVEKKRMRV